jgi:hypothetical protein
LSDELAHCSVGDLRHHQVAGLEGPAQCPIQVSGELRAVV